MSFTPVSCRLSKTRKDGVDLGAIDSTSLLCAPGENRTIDAIISFVEALSCPPGSNKYLRVAAIVHYSDDLTGVVNDFHMFQEVSEGIDLPRAALFDVIRPFP